MNQRRWYVLYGIILMMGISMIQPAKAQESAPLVLALNAEGVVGPPMAEYLARGVRLAEERNASLIVIELNTPGGGGDSMNDIIETLRASQTPVVVYVTPRGGRAASAGALITIAGHLSAMAPETTIGAASPVDGQGKDLESTLKAKYIEDMKARVRTLTDGRPAEATTLAEDMVEKALAVTSDEALKIGLIDLIAEDRADLLRQLDGMTVETSRGPITLHTAGAVINPVNLLFIEQMLVVLTDPNIVFLLITIGVQAILIEISSPGGWVAGFIGVVCLALATYGIGVLPVNWFGVVFLATAFALFVLDVKAPTHGALTVAGIVSLIIGALVLFNSPGTPQFQQVSVPLVIAVSLITAGTFFTLVTFAIRAQKAPLKMGQETLIGQNGTARSDIAPHGNVQLGGELWSAALAEDEAPIPAHARVEVVRVEGLRLIVRRAGESAVK